MKILAVVLIVAIILIYYLETRSHKVVAKLETFAEAPKPKPSAPQERSWNDIVQDKSLDPSIKDSHANYVANVRQYSSGANFTSVADDNTSGIFTNFLGFQRPRYVPIDPSARQIPDIDNEVLKRNKHMTFKSDYNL